MNAAGSQAGVVQAVTVMPQGVTDEAVKEVGTGAEATQVIRRLIDVCTNRTQHVGMGMCPDSIEGHDVRDDECPACAAIAAAEKLLKTSVR